MNALSQQQPPALSAFAFDDQQQLLDELLEIFAPAPAAMHATGSSSSGVFASPASVRYYDSYSANGGGGADSSAYPMNNNSSYSSSSYSSSGYYPDVSPIKKPGEYRDHPSFSGFVSTPGSPSASSGDDEADGMYVDSGGDVDFEVNASDSPRTAKKKRQLEMRRKRNRESMRRVRQRKRLEYSELKKLLPGLEARLKHLREMKEQEQARQLEGSSSAETAMVQSSGSSGVHGAELSDDMEKLRIDEEAYRSQNARLEQEIDKYEQAFIALHDTIDELRQADALTEAPLETDPFAWTARAIAFLPQFHQKEMVEFVRHSAIEVVRQVEAAHQLRETASDLFGWRTRRTVAGPWIHFSVSKDFMHEDVDVVARKTWFVNSQSHTIHATMPRNHYMKVLRVVNDNTIICARNLFFPGDETNYCNIYLLMQIKTTKGYVIAQRSLLPDDSEVFRLALGPNFSYVNVFYAMILERHMMVDSEGNSVALPTGFKATFGGRAGNGTEVYANTWAKDLFIAMLRWESACVGPLYRLL